MAVIGRRALVFSLCLAAATVARADESADLRNRLLQIANAVAAGNSSDAMDAFSKTFKDYDKLRDYFSGLSQGFKIDSEVDFLDDPSDGPEPEMNIRWTLTLADPQTNFSSRRTADIKVRFARDKKKWKIVDFAPIDLFNPTQAAQALSRSAHASSQSSL